MNYEMMMNSDGHAFQPVHALLLLSASGSAGMFCTVAKRRPRLGGRLSGVV